MRAWEIETEVMPGLMIDVQVKSEIFFALDLTVSSNILVVFIVLQSHFMLLLFRLAHSLY